MTGRAHAESASRQPARRTGGSRHLRSRAGLRASAGSTSRGRRHGPEGRIVAEDVERAAAPAGRPRPPSAAPPRQVEVETAHSDAQDDRAPPDRGMAGACLPARSLGRHDAARTRSVERLRELHPDERPT